MKERPRSSKERPMKVRDVISILIGHGIKYDRQRGSHRQYEGYVSGRKRLVTVPGRDGDDLKRGTPGSIIRRSG